MIKVKRNYIGYTIQVIRSSNNYLCNWEPKKEVNIFTLYGNKVVGKIKADRLNDALNKIKLILGNGYE